MFNNSSNPSFWKQQLIVFLLFPSKACPKLYSILVIRVAAGSLLNLICAHMCMCMEQQGVMRKAAYIGYLTTQNSFWWFLSWALRNFTLYTFPASEFFSSAHRLWGIDRWSQDPLHCIISTWTKSTHRRWVASKRPRSLLVYWLPLLDLCVSLFHNVYSRKCLVNT